MRIAFGNKARSGKDTACDYLLTKYSGVILRFSTPVYEIVSQIQQYLGYEIKKDPKMLQFIGDGLRRQYNSDIWVNYMEKCISEIDKNVNIYIADVRYPNEAEMLKKNGFKIICINREERPIDRDPNHESEIALDNYKFDEIINNNGTLNELYETIDKIIK